MSFNELAERVGIFNVDRSKIKNNKVTAVRFAAHAAICQAGDILEFQKEDEQKRRRMGRFCRWEKEPYYFDTIIKTLLRKVLLVTLRNDVK